MLNISEEMTMLNMYFSYILKRWHTRVKHFYKKDISNVAKNTDTIIMLKRVEYLKKVIENLIDLEKQWEPMKIWPSNKEYQTNLRAHESSICVNFKF